MKTPRARWWDPRTWLAFMFWELRTIARAISDDGLSDLKAIGTIVIFEILAIVGLTDATSVYLGRRLIDKGSPFVFLVAFAVAFINIPAALGKFKRWHRLGKEFESYSKPTRIAGGIVVVLLFIGAIVCTGYFGEAQHLLPR
jgi:predicted permease